MKFDNLGNEGRIEIMKILIIILLSVSISFAQMANGESSKNLPLVSIVKPEGPLTYLNKDLNKDGKFEILRGEKIIKIGDNEYWVKNTEMTSSGGDIYTFYNKLKKNDAPVVRQVTADYGYILIFEPGNENVEVYLAGETGSKESDPLFISLK